jgi:hypothetical protein
VKDERGELSYDGALLLAGVAQDIHILRLAIAPPKKGKLT